MENIMEYTDDFIEYKGDYDEFEYDVKLKDGRVIENCYPNARKFNSLNDGEWYGEELVEEIRFSNNPKTELNENVSKICKEQLANGTHYLQKKFDDEEELIKNKPGYHRLNSKTFGFSNPYMNINNGQMNPSFVPYKKPDQYIRSSKKISRNSTCSCGSGKKYKKCCINN